MTWTCNRCGTHLNGPLWHLVVVGVGSGESVGIVFDTMVYRDLDAAWTEAKRIATRCPNGGRFTVEPRPVEDRGGGVPS